MDNFLIVSYFVLAVCLGYGFYRLITKIILKWMKDMNLGGVKKLYKR